MPTSDLVICHYVIHATQQLNIHVCMSVFCLAHITLFHCVSGSSPSLPPGRVSLPWLCRPEYRGIISDPDSSQTALRWAAAPHR